MNYIRNYSGLPSACLLTAYGSSPGVWSGCGLCRRRRHSPHPLQTWVSRRRRREVLNSYLYSTDLSSCTNGPLMVFTLISSFLALCYTALEDWKGDFYYET